MPTRARLAACAVIAAGLVAVPSFALAFELRPGLWREVETGEEDGKPYPPETDETCMSPEEAKDIVKALTLPDESEDACKIFDVKRTANSLSLRMQCLDEEDKSVVMDVSASYTFVSPEHYTGDVKSAITLGGEKMTSSAKIEARRIGECKED